MRFRTDEKLAAVTGGDTVFEDANSVSFGGRLQLNQPFAVRDRLPSPEDCQAPVELVGR